MGKTRGVENGGSILVVQVMLVPFTRGMVFRNHIVEHLAAGIEENEIAVLEVLYKRQLRFLNNQRDDFLIWVR